MSAKIPAHPRAGLNKAPLLAVGSMVSIQSAAALSQPLLTEIGATPTTWIRLVAAAAILLAVTRPWSGTRSAWDLTGALMLGVALAGMTVCFFEAVRRVPLGLTTTIAFLGPMGVATFGSRRLADLGMAALAALGVTLLVRPYATGWPVDPVGLTFAGSAALCWAGYILLTKRVGAAFSGLQGLAIALAVAALVVTPLGLTSFNAWPQPSQIVAAAGLAILAPVLPCGLEMIALRQMGARPFGILMSLEPAIGVAVGYLLLHQEPNDAQLLGVMCVVAASAGAVTATARPRPAEVGAGAPVLPLPAARSK